MNVTGTVKKDNAVIIESIIICNKRLVERRIVMAHVLPYMH